MAETVVETERLVLREWRDDDLEPFHAICSDPEVMATLGPVMTMPEVANLIGRMQNLQSELGHCFWALECKEAGDLLGWCGLIRGTAANTPITGKLEIGWRLARRSWGHGYATEAARCAMQWAFNNQPDDTIWAITSFDNQPSRAVMKRLGMQRRVDLDFDHPNVPNDSPLLRHVTYAIERSDWEQKADVA